MRTRGRAGPESEREDAREAPHARPEDAILVLQRTAGNQAVQRVLRAPASVPVSRAGSLALHRWTVSGEQSRQLSEASARLKELEADYENDKAAIMDALEVKNKYNDALAYLHKMDLGYIRDRLVRTDKFFQEAKDLARQAITSKKSFDAFLRKVNGYDKSGGKNAIKNAVNDVDRELKSVERNELTQITQLDQDYFEQYLTAGKTPMRVYRGNGIGVDANSLDNFVFQDIPYGGTPDVSFWGVVEHTHTNTLKNGMVSTTSSKDVAHFWATEKHNYGIVFEIELDNYIHVANLLKKRKFKDRYPGQYEVLAPGSVPASKVVSATLYQKANEVKTVRNGA